MTHTSWAHLPETVRAAVTARTGPVAATRHIPDGLSSDHASILATAAGAVFVKATRSPADHVREASVAPHVIGVGPPMRWHARAGEWDVIGFDALTDARHTRLAPGSADLPLLADLLARSTTLTAPVPLPPLAEQWARYASPAELAHLDGDALVHGDINQHNVLVCRSGGRSWLVDWAMARRGPVWADVAEAAVRLIEDGHTADDAHAWACRIPAWRVADPAAVAAWAAVRCRPITAALGEHGARHTTARHRALVSCVTGAARRRSAGRRA
ncbi:aminoglycoside phosphotransferase [Wenjunlia vitaminophila]|uniref:Aminoglycoside phosphotransferase n=1 Tax=Wenjunlia vitaminophila TaxID=76728 RepID=A0A0T6LQA7_WENVI|nr:phosphotransferase [Wenjunlia vitaminophila]KRV47980.1 aminoglycoside phosphotransferase [Wenjunlia vitaminophila]